MSDWDLVVVGGGLGGLAGACTAAAAGARVLVCEAKPRAGGYATSFDRGGFRFDASLHLLDAVEPGCANAGIWEALGLRKRVRTVVPSALRAEIWPDHALRFPPGMDTFAERVAAMFPRERAGIRAACAEAAAVHAAFVEDRDARLDGRVIAAMPDVLAAHIDRTAAQSLSRHLEDPRAVAVFGSLATYLGLGVGDIAAIPFLAMLHSYHGGSGSYVHGGSQAITDALVDELAARGGTLRTGAPVAKILTSRGGRITGVTTADGETHTCRAVLNNGSPHQLYDVLLDARRVDARQRRRLSARTLGPSVLKVWLGVVADDVSGSEYETFVRGDYAWSFVGHEGSDLAVVAPHLLDPHCAPEGHAIYTLTSGWPPEVDSIDAATAEARADAMIERAEATLLPGLRERIVVRSVARPATFAYFTGNPGGTIHGFASTPSQAGPRRFPIRGHLPGLFHASGWTYAGSGFLPAMTSGMIAANHIVRECLS